MPSSWNNSQKFIVRYADDPNPDLYTLSRHLTIEGTNSGNFYNRSASPLHLSTTGKSIKIMKLLVELHFASVHVIDKQGATPLHWACQKGNLEMIRYLIEKNSSLTAVDYSKFIFIFIIF